jgi:CRP/FNR family cyclic AMP-dependent transcriptional regulator
MMMEKEARPMIKPTAETLLFINLFRNLPPNDRKGIAERCQTHHYAKGQEILAYKDESRDVFFIVSGQVRATIYSVTGREVTFRDLGAGEIFGNLSAVDGKPRASSVIALADTIALSMPSPAFRGLLANDSAICLSIVQELTGLVRLLSNRVFEFSTLGVRNRIHAELLRLARKNMETKKLATISPSPKHVDIASRVSTHREAVTKELNQLVHDGLIQRRGRTLVINDVQKLTQMVEEVGTGV